jgi:hypothetical protein
MKVKKNVAAVMLATGVLAVLGFGGAALADGGSDDAPSRTVASATESPSPEASLDDSLSFDDSPSPDGSPSPDDSPSVDASPSVDDSPIADVSPSPSAPSGSGSASSSAGVTAGQAKTIALRAAGGGRVESIEREREHGRLVWDVDVIVKGVEHDIDVDATTGQVTRHRTDDDRGRGRGGDDSGRDDRGRGGDDSGKDDRGRGGDDSGKDDRGRGGDDD